MHSLIWGYVICYTYLFSVIFGIGLLQKKFNFSIETSRKVIHTLIVFTWVFLYRFFWNDWQIIIIPITFIVINALSYKFKLFKMIERDGNAENHKGTIYFSIGITVLMGCALVWQATIMETGIATFALCFGDGIAALVGSNAEHKYMIRKDKSLQGTLACAMGTVVGLTIFSWIMSYRIAPFAILFLSLETAILELVGYGLDNFSIIFGIYSSACLLKYMGALL